MLVRVESVDLLQDESLFDVAAGCIIITGVISSDTVKLRWY